MAPKTMHGLLEEVNKQIGVKETRQGKNFSSLSVLLPSSKSHGEHDSSHDQERGQEEQRQFQYLRG